MSPFCDKCENKETLFEKYDAWACLHCDEWKEKKCKDPDCYFCPNRPDRPSEARN